MTETKELTFVIKKENLTAEQLIYIRNYKTWLLPADSTVEEYQPGFKFYLGPSVIKSNLVSYFLAYGIISIAASLFTEEWNY